MTHMILSHGRVVELSYREKNAIQKLIQGKMKRKLNLSVILFDIIVVLIKLFYSTFKCYWKKNFS